jgi:hypothetical protein
MLPPRREYVREDLVVPSETIIRVDMRYSHVAIDRAFDNKELVALPDIYPDRSRRQNPLFERYAVRLAKKID